MSVDPLEFFERVERLCRTVADSIPTTAEPGTLRDKLIRMADEAADFSVDLRKDGPTVIGQRVTQPAKIILNLDAVEEALA